MSSSLIYSTIEFHALPLRALFLCPQPCYQLPVFERVAEPSLPKVAVMGKDAFPKKRPKWAPFFSVFSVWRTVVLSGSQDFVSLHRSGAVSGIASFCSHSKGAVFVACSL